MFDTVVLIASSMFLYINWYFDFIIINVENDASSKYVVQNGRSLFRAISEIVGNSILIKHQNPFFKGFRKFKWEIQTPVL